MKETFDAAFDLVVGSEGGYDTTRADRGNWTSGVVGEGQLKGTKYGIASHVYPSLDIKNLTLEQAKEIYRRDYWDRHANELPRGIDYLYFDMCVNNGRGTATKIIQRALGVNPDGAWGPLTQAAVDTADLKRLISEISIQRERYYRQLSTFWKFGRGWIRRVHDAEAAALRMIKEK